MKNSGELSIRTPNDKTKMELNRANEKQLNIILFCIAALLLAYTSARAFLIDFTWDEASTYLTYVRNGIVIVSDYDVMSANNHILNTFLMLCFTKLFGATEFVMRIPVLIAHLLFLLFSARLVKNTGGKWLAISAFIIINVNPYMLDFFSLARGYGLSLGLMMGSVYYFFLFHAKEKKNRYSALTILFAGLAVLANFVLLNYCLAVFGAIILLHIYFAEISGKPKPQKYKDALKGIIVPSFLMLILLLFVIPIGIKLKNIGALFFGGDISFWNDTMNTIVDRSFYEIGYSYRLQQLAKGFMVLVITASVILVVFKTVKKQLTSKTVFLMSLLFLIFMCSLSTIMQHYLFATPYLMERTALFLVVLFSLIFVFLVSEFTDIKNIYVWITHASGAILILHFIAAYNLKYVLEWKLNADTREMLSDLDKVKQITKGKETMNIGTSLIFECPLNYYRQKNNMFWMNTLWRFDSRSMLNEYFFLEKKHIGRYNPDSLEIIKTYPLSGSVFAKSKYLPKEMKVVFTKEHSFEKGEKYCFEMDEAKEFAPDFVYIVNDSVTPKKAGIVAFYAEVMAPDISCDNIQMVFSFQNDKGEIYKWQKTQVKDFIKREKEWFRATYTCIIPDNVKHGDEIKAYFWNKDKERLYIQSAEFKWLEPHY